MIYIKDYKQYDMFNPFEHLGPKRLALLESSWAHLFREEILHKLPAEKLFHCTASILAVAQKNSTPCSVLFFYNSSMN